MSSTHIDLTERSARAAKRKAGELERRAERNIAENPRAYAAVLTASACGARCETD